MTTAIYIYFDNKAMMLMFTFCIAKYKMRAVGGPKTEYDVHKCVLRQCSTITFMCTITQYT